MPTAICASCNQITHWRNQRGARLADMGCHCGGRLKAAVWTGNGYQIREAHSANKGRTRVECLCCGCPCLLRETSARTVKMVLSNIGLDARNWAQTIWIVQIEVGDALCSRCRPYEYISSYRLGIETYDWLYKQINGVGVNYPCVGEEVAQ